MKTLELPAAEAGLLPRAAGMALRDLVSGVPRRAAP